METGLLNFHDEEHFPVFCDENSELVNDHSIFNSFVDFSDEAAAWILPDSDIGFGLNSVISETKEDYQKIIQDWHHVSNPQVRENDPKDDSNILDVDPFGDVPDVFDHVKYTPKVKTEVPKEEISTYKVAKREGLVLKLTKKKDNKSCDKLSVGKSKKDDSGKQKKKALIPPKSKIEKRNQAPIKSEPLDEYEIPSNELEIEQAVANIGLIEPDGFKEFQDYNFNEEPIEYCDLQQSIVNDFELEQAVAQIEPQPQQLPNNEPESKKHHTLEKEKKLKSSKSKKRHSGNKIVNNSLPLIKIEKEDCINEVQVKIEKEDFCTGKLEKDSEFTIVLHNIKQEPNTSPYNYAESPNISTSDNYFGTEPTNEEHIDVEHIDSEPAPILEAGDMNSLLKQFESSDPVNNQSAMKAAPSNNANKTMQIMKTTQPEPKQSPLHSVLKPTTKSILEALPKEVIERIKESSKRNKKSVPVVPAERLPRKGCDNLKDAGATPTKAQRIMNSNQRRSGETVKLDHDYCSNASQIQETQKEVHKRAIKEEPPVNEWERKWDSKKDSGLESGDVSDSNESLERKLTPQASNSESAKDENQGSLEPGEIIDEEPTKKKKLNLEEYRNRRKNIIPKSPIKHRTNGWIIPTPSKPNGSDKTNEAQKVNAEVQVKIEDTKIENSSDNRIGRSPIERLRRRSSSSSSSSIGKSRYHRRGRSKRRRHSRKHCWSRSRSRSRSRSHSRSRSRSRSHSRSRTRSRSRSRSRSSSYSYTSSSSRSRSRSRGRSRRRHRSRSSYRRTSSHRYSSRNRSRFSNLRRSDDWSPVEKMRQVEERRVIYVGRLEEGTTRAQLRERFAMFGPIVDISLHFREKGDNYGFVTFAFKADAYEAVEHGNDYPYQPKYDICFGGRRAFCKQRYSDLDGTSPQSYSPHQQNSRSCDSFDKLLREAQKKLKRSNHV